MTRQTNVTTVYVKIVRDEVSFYASSPDVPGLHICGSSFSEICERVVLGIKVLFKLNKGLDVEVIPAAAPADFPNRPDRCSNFVVAQAA